MAAHVPSPADAPEFSARQLLREIRKRGGKTYRMRQWCVFVITDNRELVEWLQLRGARSYLPRGMSPNYDTPPGSYRNAPGGTPRWDLYIHHIPVKGEETIWEAARLADAGVHRFEDAAERGFLP